LTRTQRFNSIGVLSQSDPRGRRCARERSSLNQRSVFTVGHSTRSVDEFVELLRGHGVGQVADVRTIPRSRHNPQFNEDALERSLSREEIGYIHMKALGGFRHALKDSPNDGWRNASFRGFADYMATA